MTKGSKKLKELSLKITEESLSGYCSNHCPITEENH